MTAAGLPVEGAVLRVVQRPELDPGDVAQAHQRAVGVLAHDDVAELLGRDEAALRADRVGELLAVGAGSAPTWPAGLTVFCAPDRVLDVADGEPERREHVGLHPDAHRVVGGAEVADVADAADAQERVVDVDRGVVGEERGVVASVRRVEREDDQREGQRLLAS